MAAKEEKLYKDQLRLEDEALANGAARFRKRLEELALDNNAVAGGAARRLLQKVLDPTINAMEEVLLSEDRRGYGATLVKWLERVGPAVAAYMTLKVLLGRPEKPQNVVHLAPAISSLIHDEIRYRRLRKKARGLFEYRIKSFNTTNYKHKAYSLNQAARFAGVEDGRMPERDSLLLGMKLINICLMATNIGSITHEKRKKGGKWQQKKLFHLNPEISQLLSDSDDLLQFQRPQALPMVVEPLPWSPELNGGYRFALRGRYGLIRKSRGKRAREADMPFVYDGLNKIQSTAWRVNSRVLDVVLELKSDGRGIGGLPNAEPEALPPKLEWMEQKLSKQERTEIQEEELRVWKRSVSEIKERNNLRSGRLIASIIAIQLAQQFRDYESIWFPHNLDFRGRCYPICDGLQPQGNDLQRGMLCFAEKLPIGPDGHFWLAVHGANALGEFDGHKFSKESFEQRVAWIEENVSAISAVADNPATITWWTQAEEPFQFLAFCFEYSEYIQHLNNGARGEDFLSNLPVAQDGTCNGLQHFAALLRDPIGGKAVNLTPEFLPSDVYESIHYTVRENITREAIAGVPEARWWLNSGTLSRGLFKRPTMTFAYGSKTFGMARQIEEYLVGKDNWQEINRSTFALGDGNTFIGPLCRYMASQIWIALESVVVAAFSGMEWLSECAGRVCDTTKVVEWTVPVTGFPARQEYWDVSRHRVQTVLAGSAVTLSTFHQTKTPLRFKHQNAIAPNLIHSLDAAALMMTVVLSASEGVNSFGMVHDSYSTHACFVPAMAAATREAFIALYDGRDVSGNLHREFSSSSEAEIPNPPLQGDLDLQKIRESRYFFS